MCHNSEQILAYQVQDLIGDTDVEAGLINGLFVLKDMFCGAGSHRPPVTYVRETKSLLGLFIAASTNTNTGSWALSKPSKSASLEHRFTFRDSELVASGVVWIDLN